MSTDYAGKKLKCTRYVPLIIVIGANQW